MPAGRLALLTIGVLAVTAGPALAHEDDGHPAKLHEGTCAEVGPVAFPLAGVGAVIDVAGAAVDPGAAVNPDRGVAVERGMTAVTAPLADLLAAPYALVVYSSDEDLSAIACGDLAGNLLDNELAVGLVGVGDAGVAGIALFEDGGTETTVRLYLGHELARVGVGGTEGATGEDHDAGTGAATPSHDDAAAEDHRAASATPGAGA